MTWNVEATAEFFHVLGNDGAHNRFRCNDVVRYTSARKSYADLADEYAAVCDGNTSLVDVAGSNGAHGHRLAGTCREHADDVGLAVDPRSFDARDEVLLVGAEHGDSVSS